MSPDTPLSPISFDFPTWLQRDLTESPPTSPDAEKAPLVERGFRRLDSRDSYSSESTDASASDTDAVPPDTPASPGVLLALSELGLTPATPKGTYERHERAITL